MYHCFMSISSRIVQNLHSYVDDVNLLQELLCFGQIKHTRTQRSLEEDWISPSGSNGKQLSIIKVHS
jgi:hypothetical protein